MACTAIQQGCVQPLGAKKGKNRSSKFQIKGAAGPLKQHASGKISTLSDASSLQRRLENHCAWPTLYKEEIIGINDDITFVDQISVGTYKQVDASSGN